MIKKLLLSTVVALAMMTSASAVEGEWLTDFAAAKAKAKAENKKVLMDFTGSDWCGWCIKLHKEVFSQKEFVDYAKDNLVLVTVDFPEKKKLPKAQQAANDSLAKKYDIEGYPTLIILNNEGKKLGQMGYVEGGPKPFLAELKKITEKTK
jgi:protein disulfide-isomerase